MITAKTINYIIWRLKNDLPDLFERVPINNDKHPDKRINARYLILEDLLRYYSHEDANTLIRLIKEEKEEEVEQFLFGLNNNLKI